MDKFDEVFSRYYVEPEDNILVKVSAPFKVWREYFKVNFEKDIKNDNELRQAIIDLSDVNCDFIFNHLYNEDYEYANISLDDFDFITVGDNNEIEVSDEFLEMLDKLSSDDRQTAYAELDNANVQAIEEV